MACMASHPHQQESGPAQGRAGRQGQGQLRHATISPSTPPLYSTLLHSSALFTSTSTESSWDSVVARRTPLTRQTQRSSALRYAATPLPVATALRPHCVFSRLVCFRRANSEVPCACAPPVFNLLPPGSNTWIWRWRALRSWPPRRSSGYPLW